MKSDYETLINTITRNEIDPAFALRSEKILQTLAQHKPKRILDAGCGRGYYVKCLSLFDYPVEIHGIDLKKEYAQKAKRITKTDSRVHIHVGSVYELPFKNGYFDAIINSEVLEHLTHDARAVKEIDRVLKKGGLFVGSVPHSDYPFMWDPLNWILTHIFGTHVPKNIWWLAGIWADHERLYSQKELETVLTFNMHATKVKITPLLQWCWPFSHFVLYGIGKNIVEKFGRSAASFDRFNVDTDKPMAQKIAHVMKLPQRVLSKKLTGKRSMNLFFHVQK